MPPNPVESLGQEETRLAEFCPSQVTARELVLFCTVLLLALASLLRSAGEPRAPNSFLSPQHITAPPLPIARPCSEHNTSSVPTDREGTNKSAVPPNEDVGLKPDTDSLLPAVRDGMREIPFGQVWKRWDAPHGANHMTWLVTGARLVVKERRLLVKSNADRPLDLAVRSGSTTPFLAEAASPPPCTHALSTALVSTSAYAASWNNFWHFNADDFFLMTHVLMNEHAAGAAGPLASPSLFLSPPFSVLDTVAHVVPPFDPLRNVSRFINDEVRAFFGASPLADAPTSIFWLRGGGVPPHGDPGADAKLAAARESTHPPDERVVCIDRLYVGSDTQCALNNVMDAAGANRDECESVYRMFRAAVAKTLGEPEGTTMELRVAPRERPRVFLVDRGEGPVQGKRISNLSAALAEVRGTLNARIGVGGFDLTRAECSTFAETARWWGRATIVILARGACQANMPLTRDGGGILWIGPCGDDMPQLRPMPTYFFTEVYHPPVVPGGEGGQCNSLDIVLPPGGLGAALGRLLDKAWGR